MNSSKIARADSRMRPSTSVSRKIATAIFASSPSAPLLGLEPVVLLPAALRHEQVREAAPSNTVAC
jgi:hypothetical protein